MLRLRFKAAKPEELAKGLMFSNPLAIDECAFFQFNHLSDHSFWNKNVSFPITLLFLDENFEIRNIGKLDAHQETPCKSNYPYIKYVIEGHKDLCKENAISIGDFCLPEENIIKIIKGKQNFKKK